MAKPPHFLTNQGMIVSFSGAHRWLSNFAPVEVVLDGTVYPSVEHAYVAAKTLDLGVREAIRALKTPGEAKRFGRTFKLRPDWDDVKLDVMEGLLRQKFLQLPYRQQLIETGDTPIVEGNTWGDTFWGVCKGVGHNHLGELLMAIRADLRKLSFR